MLRYPGCWWIVVALCAITRPGAAQVDVRAVADALRTEGALPSRAAFTRPRVPALIQLPRGAGASPGGLERVGTTFGVRAAPMAELAELCRANPDWQVTWSAPLRLLSDRAGAWVGAPGMRNATGRTGQGVLVGIADTGVDVLHADLRNRDGTTRLRYYVDFSRPPAGRYPEAEARCTRAGLDCAVFDAAVIDAQIRAGGGTLPVDVGGHGTHVASLAAGNGGEEGRYVGLAPEAGLVVANVIGADGAISDAIVLLAVDLLFYLAEEEGKKVGLERLPMVVNLSLGSDFGPHDGMAALDRGLAELVGPELPGRSIVVAGGNSGGLLEALTPFPDPLGVHTDVHVPERTSVRVPIVAFPPTWAGSELDASLLVWIAFRPGDEVSVGVDRRSGTLVSPVAPGRRRVWTSGGKLSVTVLNGSGGGPDGPSVGAAAVLVEGTWARQETFAIRLEGHGTASLWIQSEGELLPGGQELGALFPAATKESTLTLPATSPELIAVGATLNRVDWTDRSGDEHLVDAFGGVFDPVPDSVAFFSSAGPTTDSRLKPDILAPGAFVVGAMSRDADPLTSGFSIFAGAPCGPAIDCGVVDDAHAVTLGTSMAAPIVAGAVALLFEGDPTLTQDQILALIQAGARRPTGLFPTGAQAGAGMLDLEGILDAEGARAAGESAAPSAGTSWLTLGQSLARPDPGWGIPAVLQLRDATGARAFLPDPDALDIDVDNGRVVSRAESALPGIHAFTVAAADGTGGETLVVRVRYDGREVARATLPIAVDTNVARGGFTARGGCSVGGVARGARGTGASAALTGVGGLVGLALRRRRVRRAAWNCLAHCRAR